MADEARAAAQAAARRSDAAHVAAQAAEAQARAQAAARAEAAAARAAAFSGINGLTGIIGRHGTTQPRQTVAEMLQRNPQGWKELEPLEALMQSPNDGTFYVEPEPDEGDSAAETGAAAS